MTLNLPALRSSFRLASRKPGTLEAWVFENVPKLLDEVEILTAFDDGPDVLSREGGAWRCWRSSVQHWDEWAETRADTPWESLRLWWEKFGETQ